MAYSERYKKFIAAKTLAGSFNKIPVHPDKQWVYFTNEGTIVGISTLPINRDNWIGHQFTWEQVSILRESNWNNYYVYVDPTVDNLYEIRLRPEENLWVDSESHDLHLVPFSSRKGKDTVVISISGTKIDVCLGKGLLEKYNKIELGEAKARGNKIMKFYLTATTDPHTYVWDFSVSLQGLLLGKCTFTSPVDVNQCYVFTRKVFDNYICIKDYQWQN